MGHQRTCSFDYKQNALSLDGATCDAEDSFQEYS